MKTLSVIIPLYNAENYICQAINSVLCQKDIEIEIIVVNDGSTDHSLERLSVFDERVKIVSISNSGASAARNVGLKYATGEYVMFLDSDDYIDDDNICNQAIEIIEDKKSDMCMFLYTYNNVTNDSLLHLKKYPQFLLEETDCERIIYHLVNEGIAPVSPCCKIIKRSHLVNHNLFFMEGTVAEDIEWFVRLFINTNKICLLNNDSYIYRKNLSSSVTGSTSKIKCINHYSMISMSIERIDKCKDRKKNFALLSLLAYQYCIWMSQIWKYIKTKEFVTMAQSLCWLLNYDLFPRVKYVRWIYRILDIYTSCLLCLFYKLLSKSNR